VVFEPFPSHANIILENRLRRREDDVDELHRCACTRPPSPLAGRDAVMAAHEGKVGLISATAIWRGLVTIVGRVKPRLVIIDTLADVFAGNENARQFGGG
jgi:hypothetical protein